MDSNPKHIFKHSLYVNKKVWKQTLSKMGGGVKWVWVSLCPPGKGGKPVPRNPLASCLSASGYQTPKLVKYGVCYFFSFLVGSSRCKQHASHFELSMEAGLTDNRDE